MEPMTILLSLIPSGISTAIAIMAWQLRTDTLAAKSHRTSISSKLEKLEQDHRDIITMLKEHVLDDAHNDHAHSDLGKELERITTTLEKQREDMIILKTRTGHCLESRGFKLPE